MGSFIWYELMTDDADRAAAFYGALIGWNIEGGAADQVGASGYRHIRRSDRGNQGGILPLSADMKAGGARPGWLPYLNVAKLDATLDAIGGDGGRVLRPPTHVEGAGTFAMVADPQGVPVYVMTPQPPAGRPDAVSDVFSRTELQRVSWNELSSPDLAGAKAFYARHFGFEFKESMPMGPMGDYCFIDHGGQRLGAIMQRQDADQPAAWLLFFRVPSVTAARDVIETHGGRVLRGPMEVPGGEWVVYGTDPDGARFGLVSPGK